MPKSESQVREHRPNLNFTLLNETKFASARWAPPDMEVGHVDYRFCHNYCYGPRLRRDGRCQRVSRGCFHVWEIVGSVELRVSKRLEAASVGGLTPKPTPLF